MGGMPTGMGTARTAHIPCGGLKLAHTRDDRRDHLTGLRRWRKHPGHTLTGGGAGIHRLATHNQARACAQARQGFSPLGSLRTRPGWTSHGDSRREYELPDHT